MNELSLNRKQVIAIGAVFAIILIGLFWWKLNPPFDKDSYYKDAARLQQQERGLTSEVNPAPAPAQSSSDNAYQPEVGNN